jgi:hypothetical protein
LPLPIIELQPNHRAEPWSTPTAQWKAARATPRTHPSAARAGLARASNPRLPKRNSTSPDGPSGTGTGTGTFTGRSANRDKH